MYNTKTNMVNAPIISSDQIERMRERNIIRLTSNTLKKKRKKKREDHINMQITKQFIQIQKFTELTLNS